MTRRTFILGSGVMAAAPVLANAFPPLRVRRRLVDPSTDDVHLKIAGWSQGGEDANAVWITVGSSWRTAWR
jgi:hypothetical protein